MVDLINPISDARAGLPRNRQEVRTEGTALNSKAHEHAIGHHCIILLPLCFTCFTLAKDEAVLLVIGEACVSGQYGQWNSCFGQAVCGKSAFSRCKRP